MTGRPLETGWLADTPADDNIVRAFLLGQAAVNALQAAASAGGRSEQADGLALADAGGRVPYHNQALLLRPLAGPGDPLLDAVDAYYRGAGDRPRTLLSMWPTPDLAASGWHLVGHPMLVARPPLPLPAARPAPGVEVVVVTDPAGLRAVEQIAIEGYPLDELRGAPPGTLFPDGLLEKGPVIRLGLLDGVPVAAALSLVGHGIVNLAFAATLPASRRRGVWESLVRARMADAPDLPAVAYTSDYSRPGFVRLGFLPLFRCTLWARG